MRETGFFKQIRYPKRESLADSEKHETHLRDELELLEYGGNYSCEQCPSQPFNDYTN